MGYARAACVREVDAREGGGCVDDVDDAGGGCAADVGDAGGGCAADVDDAGDLASENKEASRERQ